MSSEEKKVIALSGAPQSGKSEIGPAIDALPGVEYVNLNTFGYELRRAGAETRRDVYDQLIPGLLKDNGRHEVEYYFQLLQTPGLIDAILEFELPAIREATEQLLQTNQGNNHRVLSWEYWPSVLETFPVDHVIHMDCLDREAWYRKLSKRAADRGYTGDPIPGRMFDQLIHAAQIHPVALDVTVREVTDSKKLTVVDSSPDDWNVDEVLSTIRDLTS